MDTNLTNHDLAPVPPEKRTWNTFHFFSLWVGMAVCIPTYMMAASLIGGGMSWLEALATVCIGNTIVLIPMILVGHVGAKYGISFPIFARASFGIKGSNIPAFLRAIVACGWFGIQTWIGGSAIYSMVLVIWPGAVEFGGMLPAPLSVGLVPFLCFLVFWIINIYFIWEGLDSIKWLEALSAPFLIAAGLALLVWAYVRADGWGPMLNTPSKFQTFEEFSVFFWPALTGMVGFWATLSLNIPDFTRYAKDQKAQAWGQAWGLPTTMTLFAFIGIAVTSASLVIFGEAIWDPVLLIRKFDNPFVVLISMFAVLIATLSTNVAANVVGPANDFANMNPKRINFRIGGLITGVVGILIMPWKLIEDPTGYIFTWLIGYSALLGPICGILLVDFYITKQRKIKVEDLYKNKGQYTYHSGVNWRAMGALLVGILPNVPGFFAQIHMLPEGAVPTEVVHLYNYAWFIGLFLSGFAYWIFMRGTTVLEKDELYNKHSVAVGK